jgi:hypothetical protein
MGVAKGHESGFGGSLATPKNQNGGGRTTPRPYGGGFGPPPRAMILSLQIKLKKKKNCAATCR